jgi:hypothetical protein
MTKPRRSTKDKKVQTYMDHLRALQQESGGVMALKVFDRADILAMMLHIIRESAMTLEMAIISDTLRQYHAQRDTPEGLLCGCCGEPVNSINSIVIVTARTDRPATTIATMVCAKCDGTEIEVRDRVLAAWREGIDPGARLLPPLAPGGNA